MGYVCQVLVIVGLTTSRIKFSWKQRNSKEKKIYYVWGL